MFRAARTCLFILPALAIGLASAAGAQSVSADQIKALRTSCEGDVKKLCSGVQPGGGRLLTCLKEHKAEATPPCQASLDTLAAAQRAK